MFEVYKRLTTHFNYHTVINISLTLKYSIKFISLLKCTLKKNTGQNCPDKSSEHYILYNHCFYLWGGCYNLHQGYLGHVATICPVAPARLWLDRIKDLYDVPVLGLEKTGQPATVIVEAHRHHLLESLGYLRV